MGHDYRRCSGKTLSPWQRALIRESANRGVPVKELAAFHSTSFQTIKRVLNKASMGDSRWEDDHVLSVPWSNFINLTNDTEVPTYTYGTNVSRQPFNRAACKASGSSKDIIPKIEETPSQTSFRERSLTLRSSAPASSTDDNEAKEGRKRRLEFDFVSIQPRSSRPRLSSSSGQSLTGPFKENFMPSEMSGIRTEVVPHQAVWNFLVGLRLGESHALALIAQGVRTADDLDDLGRMSRESLDMLGNELKGHGFTTFELMKMYDALRKQVQAHGR